MGRLILIALLAPLVMGMGSCGTKVEYVPFEVRVPVAVPCAAQIPAEPDWAAKGLPHATAENIDKHVDALLAERHQRKGYEEKLKAATDGCR